MTSFGGRIKLQALSMVCESQYNGWFHTIDLAHDPDPLIEANAEDERTPTITAKKILFVLTAVMNPATAPIDIIPSTPRFNIPDFSVINSPSAATNNNVAA